MREITWVASGHKVEIGKFGRTLIVDSNFWTGQLPEYQNPVVQLSLALYREALSLKSIPFQFLGLFKIINTLHETGTQQKEWIRNSLAQIRESNAVKCIGDLRTAGHDVADYLYESGRCAIAHAHSNPLVNPENAEDLDRLEADLPVIKALAEYLIENEYGIAR